MGHKYPRIGERREFDPSLNPAHAKRPCYFCNTPAVARIDIQVNWFRGEDKSYFVCNRHNTDSSAHELLQRMVNNGS